MSNMVRSLRRGVAKRRMKKEGYQRFCKHKDAEGRYCPSRFSELWRFMA